jgi:hypothetical protein
MNRFTRSKSCTPGEIDTVVEKLCAEVTAGHSDSLGRSPVELVNVSIANTGYMGGIVVCCLFERRSA